ncbi:copper chaperone PCu(A)C [Inhella proteolytica]|uniref:Copper chaperone PCu(A)C n=1 Tax=Inhella proteolytica TaxID=2795029 RepID=A0A931J5M0_9BURK|nr:copper chaperone PCu(A)C [Inhella proteolytica]MBH9578248.1 copper chaperone PCu(A)C [Inhella proteolytica]
MKFWKPGALALALLLPGLAQAQTTASEAWARGTVAAQKATGVFVQLRSPDGAKLVGGSTPAAARVEIHEMRMDDGVMKMREVPALELPAGQAVTLKPGGYHLMLMGLKQPLKAGDTLPLTLQIERPGKPAETLQLQVPVRALGGQGGPGGHGH